MIGLPNIKDLFLSVLKNDLLIKGRFYLCPKWGGEINNPNIEERVSIGAEITPGVKYPAVLMMPPRETSKDGFQFTADDNNSPFNKYLVKLLFITGASNTGENQVSEPNGLNISSHTVVDTWHDMSRCAKDFMRVLYYHTKDIQDFQIDIDSLQDIIYVTNIGDDSVSGCLLSFAIILNSGCDIETYPSDWKTSIVIPDLTIDSHPFHEVGI